MPRSHLRARQVLADVCHVVDKTSTLHRECEQLMRDKLHMEEVLADIWSRIGCATHTIACRVRRTA